MKTTIIGSDKPISKAAQDILRPEWEKMQAFLEETKPIGTDPNTDPVFFRKDLSGRDMHYSIFLSDLIHDEDEHEDDEEFLEWIEGAEIGDEYTEFNNRKYTRTA